MKYICCLDCKQEISKNNIEKHMDSKGCERNKRKGIKYTGKLTSCRYCSLSFERLNTSERANHSRWCTENPRSAIDKALLSENVTSGNYAVKDIVAWKQSISDNHKKGVYKGSGAKSLATKIKNGNLYPTDETRAKQRIAAQNATHQRKCKSTHSFTDKNGRTFRFDSKWEDALAIRLDELDIVWNRPEPIKYKAKDGIMRNYFADFYIPHLDLYLDPKNEWVQEQQKDKIEELHKNIKLIILGSLEECKRFNI